MNSSWPWSHHKASHAILQDRTRPQTGPGWCSFASINACIIFSKISFFLLHVAHSCSSTNQCISHTKTLASWPLPPQVVNCQMPLHKWQSRSRPKKLWSCLNNLTFHPLLIAPFHSISFSLQLMNLHSLSSMSSHKYCLTSSSPHCLASIWALKPRFGTPSQYSMAFPSTNKQTNDAQLIIAAPAIARRTSQQTMDTVNHRCPSTSL